MHYSTTVCVGMYHPLGCNSVEWRNIVYVRCLSDVHTSKVPSDQISLHLFQPPPYSPSFPPCLSRTTLKLSAQPFKPCGGQCGRFSCFKFGTQHQEETLHFLGNNNRHHGALQAHNVRRMTLGDGHQVRHEAPCP